MKKGAALFLAVLFCIWSLPSIGFSSSNAESAKISNHSVELGYDDGNPIPHRDPAGPDDITYDDGNPDRLNTGADYWSRVTFTPNSLFELRAVRFMPLNQGPSDDPCEVRVYSEDQESHDPDELLYSFEYDELDEWDMGGVNNNWVVHELEEEDYIRFDAGVHFSIMYGPAPGGQYRNPPQEGDGWWNLFDGATMVNRSFLSGDPEAGHRNWNELNGDLLIRANGEYLEEFIDLACVETYNEAEQWMMNPGTEQTLLADIANYGDDVDAAVVNFTILDVDNQVVFEQDVVVQNIESEDTVAVECDEVWEAPEELGVYNLFTTVIAGDDSNDDNNQAGMEQIVFNSHPEEGDPDMWLGYVDDVLESATNWNEDSGWCSVFYHPGGQQALKITAFKVGVSAEEEISLDLGINVLDLERNTYDRIWEGNANTTDEGDQYVEVELEEDEQITINENEALMVVYYFVEGAPLQIDGTPPFAGTNAQMPWAMMQTGDDGDNFYWGGTGDFPFHIKLAFSDERPEGAHMRVEPPELDFGEDLEEGVDHVINARIISYGSDTLNVTGIRVSPSAAPYFTLSQVEFSVPPGDTGMVDVTFNADTSITIDSQFLISNNSVNAQNYLWNVFAATPVSVNENILPGIPQEYSLSQNHPNPFNPVTTIDFAITKSGKVTFELYDMNGRLTDVVYSGNLPAGYHSVEVDASELPAGTYLYRLTTAEFTDARKMTLLK